MFCLEIYQREVPSPFFNSFICLHPSGKFAFPFYSNASILHVKLRYSEKASKINQFLFELTKGQIISKYPHEMIVSSKIPTELFLDFCPEIVCSFLGTSWKPFGLPGYLVSNIINNEAYRKPQKASKTPP